MSNDGAIGLIGAAFGVLALGVATHYMISMFCQLGNHDNCNNPMCSCPHHKRRTGVKQKTKRFKNPYANWWY